jgi:hypothetical protein
MLQCSINQKNHIPFIHISGDITGETVGDFCNLSGFLYQVMLARILYKLQTMLAYEHARPG